MTTAGTVRRAARTLRTSLFVRDVGSLWSAELVVLAAGLVQAVLVARELGPRDLGLTALVITYPTVVYTILDPRSSEAVVRYLAEFGGDGDGVRALAVPKVGYLADSVLAVSGLLVIVVSASWAAATFVGTDDVTDLVIVYGLAAALAAPAATSRSVLMALRQFPTAGRVQIAAAIVRLVLVGAALSLDAGVEGVVWASALSLVFESLVLGQRADRELRRRFEGSWFAAPLAALHGRLREIVVFMVYSDLTSLVGVVVKQADLLVLGWLGGPVQAGYYRLAKSASGPVANLVAPLQSAVYPRIVSHAVSSGRGTLSSIVRRGAVQAGLPLAVLVLVTVPLVPLGLELLTGPAFRPAVSITQVLLVGAAISLPFFWVRPVLLARSHLRFLLLNSVVVVAATTVGFVAVASAHGGLGIAVVRAALVSGMANVSAVVYLLWKYGRRDVPVTAPLLAAAGWSGEDGSA